MVKDLSMSGLLEMVVRMMMTAMQMDIRAASILLVLDLLHPVALNPPMMRTVQTSWL